ncbi:MAG: hypothetical protein EU518_01530 [Promethearchaeota archaeon]|nr:MAG: hypothetical protein EU518_01530 [Candidatus Lokiarchaeota archaeon]
MIEYGKEIKNRMKLEYIPNKFLSIQITPETLWNKQQEIVKIWKNFITKDESDFLVLLENIGVDSKSLITRQCHICGKEIRFSEFFKINSPLGIGKSINIWQNENINFYCMNCGKSN